MQFIISWIRKKATVIEDILGNCGNLNMDHILDITKVISQVKTLLFTLEKRHGFKYTLFSLNFEDFQTKEKNLKEYYNEH